MKLVVNLEYRTDWGQDVRMVVALHRQKGADVVSVHRLGTEDGRTWGGEVQLTEKDAVDFSYRYIVCDGERVVRREWNGVPRRFPYDVQKTFMLNDYWKDVPVLAHLYSSAYLHCMRFDVTGVQGVMYFDSTLLFRIQAPQLQKGQCLALIGSLPQLGGWVPERAMVMQRCGMHEWCLSLSAVGLQLPFEYKYVVLDERTGVLVAWEGGENRRTPDFRSLGSQEVPEIMRVGESGIPHNTVEVVWDKKLRLEDEHWKVAGVVMPVFSMRSRLSQGCGDFGDLKMMVDWAVECGMKMIQLLPIYDTTQTGTWRDCYPYNAISIYALHPIYVDLSLLHKVSDEAYMESYERERVEINALAQMDYERTFHLKMEYLHRLYEQEGEREVSGFRFQSFRKDNESWLTAYSVFCHRRDQENTSRFQDWKVLSVYDEKGVHDYAEANRHEVNFYAWVQYLLADQLSAVTRYARGRGVVLKGDIPIGISRASVEAWKEPYYFNLDGSAGAPPDDFSEDGQNWGFPTYNWQRMQEDGMRWWIERFRKMAEYFDAYRIDHVLGFFRIWEIPMSARSGLMGHFAPCLPLMPEEIERQGLGWREKMFTEPYITDKFLRELLPEQADVEWLRSNCLEALGPDWYSLRDSFRTEAQVYEYFNDEGDERSMRLRVALCRLIQNVLFLRVGEGWCPRIVARKTFAYRSLSSAEREAFDHVYEDFYYVRHNDFWAQEAMKKLPSLVESTEMLCCAEDLGMVPACVKPVMDWLKILSLEIQTMPKGFGERFARLEMNPYRSVATISTHDMPTLRLWWREDRERTRQYWREALQKDGEAPEEMPGWLCEEVVARHLFSPSMLCLISLQNWMAMDENLRSDDVEGERINVPANANHYWRWRMHLNIEDLQNAEWLKGKISELIQRSGR